MTTTALNTLARVKKYSDRTHAQLPIFLPDNTPFSHRERCSTLRVHRSPKECPAATSPPLITHIQPSSLLFLCWPPEATTTTRTRTLLPVSNAEVSQNIHTSCMPSCPTPTPAPVLLRYVSLITILCIVSHVPTINCICSTDHPFRSIPLLFPAIPTLTSVSAPHHPSPAHLTPFSTITIHIPNHSPTIFAKSPLSPHLALLVPNSNLHIRACASPLAFWHSGYYYSTHVPPSNQHNHVCTLPTEHQTCRQLPLRQTHDFKPFAHHLFHQHPSTRSPHLSRFAFFRPVATHTHFSIRSLHIHYPCTCPVPLSKISTHTCPPNYSRRMYFISAFHNFRHRKAPALRDKMFERHHLELNLASA